MKAERGTATLLAAVGIGALVWLGLLGAHLADAVSERVELETAADAAALAAVGASSGGGDPIDAASRIAALNGVDMVRCVCPVSSSGGRIVAVVVVSREVSIPLMGEMTIEASAAAEFALRTDRGDDSGTRSGQVPRP